MRRDKPSNTALIVAASLQLVDPPAAAAHLMPREAIRRGQALLQTVHPRLCALLRWAWIRRLLRMVERATLAGILLHIALRKRVLRDRAQRAVAAGCRQVVLLGAGLDTLCMELQAAYPHLCCIEIDHPASQAAKRRAARHAGQGIHYIGVDLAQQSLGAALDSCAAFRRGESTLFVAEGLLMYVPQDAVAALFKQMAAAAPDCQLAFTWLEPQADGLPNFPRRSRLVDLWLKLRGEPFLSGLPRAELPRFLAAAGFAFQSVSESSALLGSSEREALGSNGLPIEGEYICFARTGLQPN